MSENNQNNRPAGAEQNGSPAKAKHHHRHHRGGRNRHRGEKSPDQRHEIAQNGEEIASKSQKPAEGEPKKQQPKQAQKAQEKNDGAKKDNGGKGRNEKKRNRGRGHRRSESKLYDPYETPNKEEVELSALRAQIVVQAADGSVPTVWGAPVSPFAREEEKEIEIDEATVNAILNGETTAAPADPNAKRVAVVGVRFRSAGKTYYFDPRGITAKKGDFAVVETTRGPEFGEICIANTEVSETEVVSPLRPLLRIATPADIEKNSYNREKEQQAIEIFQKKIAEHKLEMKPIDVQYAFDGSKLLFYFSSEGRVDFRELVKDLASVFHTRIELRQIGIRDEAKMLGGIGACGRALCCSTFLPDFAQVSIKMAKDQNLSLNSSKISGVCGRLMCCLRYEADVYAEENRKTPSQGATVRTPDGVGTVISSNPLAGTIRVAFKDAPDTAPKQFHRDEVTVLPKEKKGHGEDKKETAEEKNAD